jgi:hypothetical protein
MSSGRPAARLHDPCQEARVVGGNRCGPLPRLSGAGCDMRGAQMTPVLVEDRDYEELGADAVPRGNGGNRRELLYCAELRDGGCGCLQRPELSFEEALAARVHRRSGVKPRTEGG